MTASIQQKSHHSESLDQNEYFDVLIVGAGISGIGAAYHLQTKCAQKSFAIVEGRETLGGTWDLFRYPGVRSDSDMHTLGFPFRPWQNVKVIADGSAILKYLQETAHEYGIDRKIRFGHLVTQAVWSSSAAVWSVEAARADGTTARFKCNFLYMCCGYYDYAGGHSPTWPDMNRYRGRTVHPQQWPDNFDYRDKRIVVIGSGATAVTLVPAMAKAAHHVTMLQRSPTYIVSRPSEDKAANWLGKRLPLPLSSAIVRWKNIALGIYYYYLARQLPGYTRKVILGRIQKELGPGYDVDKDFSPRYKPWDQRLCLVPDSDLFVAIRSGKASIVTDEIETFTEKGLRLRSGTELEADIIVTATGLKLKVLGGMEVSIDGALADLSTVLKYKDIMYSDIPNLACSFGYTNSSWTLKSDLTAEYVCRLLNYMDKHGYDRCTPRKRDLSIIGEPAVKLSSGYFQRAEAVLPKQGSKQPWKLHQIYPMDLVALRVGAIYDGAMEFVRVKK